MYIVSIDRKERKYAEVYLCCSMEDVKDSFDGWYQQNDGDCPRKLYRLDRYYNNDIETVFEGKNDQEEYGLSENIELYRRFTLTFEYRKFDIEELEKERIHKVYAAY